MWEVFAHRGEFPLVIFVFDLGHGAACYCLGSSLLRKESGRVFVVPLQFDSFVPVRDISWHLSVYVVTHGVTSAVPSTIINDLNHQIIDSVRVSWQLCLGLTNIIRARKRWRTLGELPIHHPHQHRARRDWQGHLLEENRRQSWEAFSPEFGIASCRLVISPRWVERRGGDTLPRCNQNDSGDGGWRRLNREVNQLGVVVLEGSRARGVEGTGARREWLLAHNITDCLNCTPTCSVAVLVL